MRILITFVALLSAAAPVFAAPPRPARPAEEFRLVFLDGDDRAPVRQSAYDDATIDVGRVVATRCASRGCMRTVVSRRFRLRVDAVATSARYVRTQVFLQSDVPGHRVRLDGRLLSSAPLMIDANVPLGVATIHTLEIEIPISEPAGMIAENLVWTAEGSR